MRPGEHRLALRSVTAIMGAVIGLTFLFGFGNVLALGLRLGVPVYVAPLVAPAVDLSVLGLLLGIRYLVLNGAPPDQVRPARRLLIVASVMTLALNVTEPLLAGEWGKAAFDSVGPLLLIGWAEVGPDLLQALSNAGPTDPSRTTALVGPPSGGPRNHVRSTSGQREQESDGGGGAPPSTQATHSRSSTDRARARNRAGKGLDNGDLFALAQLEDARHREQYQRPISAETLRKKLHVGAQRSRELVETVRATRTQESGSASRT